ncbi:MAG: hypothetical protein ACR2FN_08645 [Chitinophagaceae bacterium]
MKKIFLSLIVSFLALKSFAQSGYNQAIGLKFPGGFAVTYKKFVTQNNNVEAQAIFWQQGFKAVGLYEFNFDITGVNNLRWFVGPGAHIGFWNSQYQKNYSSNADFGADGIIGLDYKFEEFPINVSLDWQPSITLVGNAGFLPNGGGLGIRYTF